MEEIWREVVGFEGHYEVSNFGRVRSVERTITQESKWGKQVKRVMRGKLLRPGKASHGYDTVVLGRGNTRTVHSLVAEAFIGPCPEGHEVLHIDGTRSNNRLANLRYGTRRENILDAVANGTWNSEGRLNHLKRVGFAGPAGARSKGWVSRWQ